MFVRVTILKMFIIVVKQEKRFKSHSPLIYYNVIKVDKTITNCYS